MAFGGKTTRAIGNETLLGVFYELDAFVKVDRLISLVANVLCTNFFPISQKMVVKVDTFIYRCHWHVAYRGGH